ncbi:MAG: type II toxin-antitoxin system death-on-curing family toxin [Deltaproteobacteria bacterium]|jgi:death-on-curing protein|nr:type II toxin-antitoxin system death-on-curing family toxin [Deltaproteobacteria bacterium]
MREYLTSLEILALHQALLDRCGGAPGIRDMGAVEAAAFRPQCGYYGDIAEEAAALLESLLVNHPFVDGNKRAAFAACDVFLRINGWRLRAQPDWLFQRVMDWIERRDNRWERITQDLKSCLVQCAADDTRF